MAAGIGDALGGPDLIALARFEFGKAIDPAGRDPVRRRSIEHAWRGIAKRGNQRSAFLCRLVRQAENGEIDRAQNIGLGRGVFALGGRQFRKLDSGHGFETGLDAQARCTGLTVDEDACAHGRSPEIFILTRFLHANRNPLRSKRFGQFHAAAK